MRPLTIALTAAFAAAAAGCGDDYTRPICPTNQVYAPAVSTGIDLWPDVFLTREDASSPTGFRLDMDPERMEWIDFLTNDMRALADEVEIAGGFARNGKVLLRFDAPLGNLPASPAESLTSEVVQLLDLSVDPPARVPFSVETQDDGEGGVRVFVSPLVTLDAATRYLFVASTALEDAEGGCVGPSAVGDALLSGDAPAPEYARAASLYESALASAGLRARDVAVAVPFETHDDLAPIIAARDHAVDQSFAFAGDASCSEDGSFTRCELSFVASDYRTERYVQGGTPTSTYELPFIVWLPTERSGTVRTLMYGHGLNGDAGQARGILDDVEGKGIAVVAMNAVEHGQHPTALDGSAGALPFLGIAQNDLLIDGRSIRGNFNQTILDRLQLLTLLRQNPDIDGDGTDDLQFDELAYWGISLGGLLGPGLLALDGEIDMTILSVGGGGLTEFVLGNEFFAAFRPILALDLQLAGGVDAFLVVAQSLVDAGDPATWGAHVLRDRVVGSAPHVLLPTAEFDGTVPPETAYALARSMRLPQVGPVRTPLYPLERVAAPVSLNVDGVTAGYFQFDRVGSGPAEAGHENTPGSEEAVTQSDHFLDTWIAGAPEIIDPYPTVGTPPLVE